MPGEVAGAWSLVNTMQCKYPIVTLALWSQRMSATGEAECRAYGDSRTMPATSLQVQNYFRMKAVFAFFWKSKTKQLAKQFPIKNQQASRPSDVSRTSGLQGLPMSRWHWPLAHTGMQASFLAWLTMLCQHLRIIAFQCQTPLKLFHKEHHFYPMDTLPRLSQSR